MCNVKVYIILCASVKVRWCLPCSMHFVIRRWTRRLCTVVRVPPICCDRSIAIYCACVLSSNRTNKTTMRPRCPQPSVYASVYASVHASEHASVWEYKRGLTKLSAGRIYNILFQMCTVHTVQYQQTFLWKQINLLKISKWTVTGCISKFLFAFQHKTTLKCLLCGFYKMRMLFKYILHYACVRAKT